jgi:DNA-binding HxlR family transcriptional regulator
MTKTPDDYLDDAAAAQLRQEFRRTVSIITGRWKLEILWLLNRRVHRFGELRRGIPGITQHMLTIQLRDLEADGLVKRTVYAEVPPRVEYEITETARTLKPVFAALLKWAKNHALLGAKEISKRKPVLGE